MTWGDAAFDNGASNSTTHTYAEPGTYMVKITGGLERFNLNNDRGNAPKLQSIEKWGDMKWTSMEGAFWGASNMKYNASDAPDLSGLTDMSNMFRGAAAFDGDLSGWDVSGVTDMNGMFDSATAFNQSLSGWDVSRVTDMNGMFYNARSFNQPLNGWDVSAVTDMEYMFSDADAFNQPLNGWDVSAVTDTKEMFTNAAAFNGDLSGWDVSNVTEMFGMFSAAASFNRDISGWNVSQVTDMSNMFLAASSFNQPLSGWDVSQVTSMNSMFTRASNFNQPLNDWNVSQVVNMNGMFNGATAFDGDLSGWNVSQVEAMNGMFSGATSFNQPLSEWDVSQVEAMGAMFSGATSFDQNLGNWYVVPADTAYATSEGTLNVTTISAQNGILDGHTPNYDIGSGGDSASFNITDANTLMFEAAPSARDYTVNVTAPGGDFGTGNSRTLTVTVTADTDNTSPTIALNGLSAVTITAGTTYMEQGATCTDDTDPAPTVTTTGTVDASRPGTYTVTYTCTDSSDNSSTDTRIVTVVAAADNTPPDITLIGDDPYTIQAGTAYRDPGYSCADDTDDDKDLLLRLDDSELDVNAPGDYTITYTCTDSSGNIGTATRTVIVVGAYNAPPVITINGSSELTIQAGSAYEDAGATCTDETDGPLQVTTTGTANTDTPGTYHITYACTDSSGNESTATRQVRVVAVGPPEDNNPPRVNAGPDQTVGEGDTVALSGSAADPDAGDSVVSYSWSAPQGSGITFADGSSASTTFTAPAVDGDATFTLTLTAGDGTDSGSDGVDVTVKETGSAFITTWRTTSDNEAITIPGTGTYDVVWGDGTFSDAASGDGEFFDGVSGHVSHEYETPGTHTVSITGGLRWINLADNLANAQKLQSIEQWGGIKWDAMAFSFQGASNMVYNADDAPDLSEVADMTNMFRKASSFDGDLSSWDVSQATDMSGMFTSATAFDGDVSPWDVSSVTDMSIMFALASSFNGDLSSWTSRRPPAWATCSLPPTRSSRTSGTGTWCQKTPPTPSRKAPSTSPRYRRRTPSLTATPPSTA